MTSLPEKFREELRKLSFLSMGESSPNPPVSCLITDVENKRIFAKGRTSPTGGPHAERNAYYEFVKNGYLSKPHNVWVTLEPCTHQGKTPPCLDLILEHKPKTLYYGLKDSNPLVRKSDGLEICRNAGIQVVSDFSLKEIAEESLFGFISRIEKQKPSMIIKSAVSKEGFFTTKDKATVRLSGNLSDRLTSILRAKCDAVLIGPRTLFQDLPGLDFRIGGNWSTDLGTIQENIFGENNGFEISRSFETGVDLERTGVLKFEYGPYFDKVDKIKDLGFSSKNTNIPNQGRTSRFLKNILKYGFNPEISEIHRRDQESYQPYRVFIIFEEKNIPEAWIEKQRRINTKNDSKKCLFFLKRNESFSKKIMELLESLTENEIYTFDPETMAEECLNVLSLIGVNLMLVEGGNLMYETFSSKMRDDDLILKIQSTFTIPEGIKPKLITNSETLIWKTNVGKDIWEVHGCLPV
ncbi:bifunctional diaminohydroxyphosphoribosylaminopyrimidine deaminase/5-amino-6-(5-phosphoribosylamino)uracil reductase [Leptospira noguchii]|uniref:bifunctional diaminohydroxyphosphoribosylaminopyrimidine deaminase/5-amino-6-(5-phosphoribosylamino)uracil reductase RibD n=1 Tax=Leptospira noguchii TaxID=28182 RepID=UPI001F05F93A|nr:bifunctional diaminohydroxyphosphoribosylaminopyrimidine deaminase/5-amino-6-(5-phosphoribosylamino)uracil reductase [Leptospira noguchii]MCH1912210.1 bifunctional diaminohydroxyphosphoribosylaminopyrimidine deaminase/5-amino-6-(5-phosphoribosylamino)uracil reductase [Leptospira noguchii]MCH1915884.1 bifunctional diaminohydroxyphosphoribosylaminopyrimidine deaminase/5-amino-6-(5-phosphoribosylamino)uracil reductase [Leptospira noguchii]UOG63314.1 bifunctional diaminohydroxyphosphoribosylamino